MMIPSQQKRAKERVRNKMRIYKIAFNENYDIKIQKIERYISSI